MSKEKFKFKGKSREKTFASRSPLYSYLIVCEGEKTEPNYFESFKERLKKGAVKVKVIGDGTDTLRVVQAAKRIYERSLRTPTPYDKVWVVFDRDSFPPSDFDNAIHSADANNFGCAWSNEAFELWYLLHFEFRNSAMSRTEYKKCLSAHLGEKYKKNDPDMYRKLENNQEQAVRNSARLLEQHNGQPPSKSNPATQVHLLVEELNEYRTTNGHQ